MKLGNEGSCAQRPSREMRQLPMLRKRAIYFLSEGSGPLGAIFIKSAWL